MNEKVRIRRMTLEDVDAVHSIEQATFAMPWSRQSFVSEMTTNRCARYLVAERENEVVAYAGAWIILDEAHITNIAVKDGARGQGIGRGITEALIQYAANLGVSYMTLEVRKSNLTAQNLYRSLGFSSVGVRKKYYEDNGEDGYLMVLEHLPKAQEDFEEPETVREE